MATGTPDVRIRLSAEGVAEVVAALKTVQAEAAKSSGKQGAGFLGLNRILGSTQSLLSTIGVGIGLNTFRNWISSSAELADRLGEMNIITGASVENLSTLQFISRQAGVGLDQMGSALVRQNRFLRDAAGGQEKALKTLRDLGLSVKDFKDLDSAEAFEVVSRAIMGLPTAGDQGRAAFAVLSKESKALLPVMKALADEGLEGVKERARELNVLIDGPTAAAAGRMADDLEVLKMQGEAVGISFASTFAPLMAQSLQIVTGDISSTRSAWEKFGYGFGVVCKTVVAALSTAVDYISSGLGMTAANVVLFFETIQRAQDRPLFDVKGRLGIFQLYAKEARAMNEQADADFKERTRVRWEYVTKSPPEASGDPFEAAARAAIEAADAAEEAALRRAQSTRADVQRELAIIKAGIANREAAEKRAYTTGLTDARSYFAARREAADEAYNAELAAIRQKQALLSAEEDPEKRAAEAAALEDELAQARLQHEGAVAALVGEEADTIRELDRERLQLEQRLLTAQGQRHSAARLAMEEELAQVDLLARKLGYTGEQREAMLNRVRAVREAEQVFEDAQRLASDGVDTLNGAISDIQTRMNDGLLSQVEGERQILELEKQRLTTLRALADSLVAAADATGDPEKMAEAADFAASVQAIGYAIQAQEDDWARLRVTAIDSATDALGTFIDTGLSGTGALDEAFGQMVNSIISDIRRLASQMLASDIMSLFTSMFGGGGGGKASNAGYFNNKAGGGAINGPGTSTSDSVLIAASNGEYMVRAASVAQPGVRAHLEAINRFGAAALIADMSAFRRQVPAFAEGGLVGPSGRASGRGGGSLDGRLTVGLAPGLVLQELATPDAQRVIVRTIGNNRRAVKGVLEVP